MEKAEKVRDLAEKELPRDMVGVDSVRCRLTMITESDQNISSEFCGSI